MKFRVNKITGFHAIAPVSIYDKKGREFYIKNESSLPDVGVFFNLPRGEYLTDNKLRELPIPVRYDCPPLPDFEKVRKVPKIKIIIKPNPHKCSVYYNTGKIIIDPTFANQALPKLKHILYHEIGHFRYKTEYKCDMFSCREMLKNGFNPSQCIKVMLHNLSSDKAATLERTTKNLEYLEKVKTWVTE